MPPLPPASPPAPPPSTITAPTASIFLASSVATVTLEGANVQPGDRAKWVRAEAKSCSSEYDALPWSAVTAATPAQAGSVTASFSVDRAAIGLLALCYKFNYQHQPASAPQAPPTPYLLFPHIRVAVVSFDSVTPRGTAVGCASNLTIDGAGFTALASVANASHVSASSPAPAITCAFGSVGSALATLLTDTRLVCTTIVPTAAAPLPLRIELGQHTASLPAAFPTFEAYDASKHQISSMLPAGGAYNLAKLVGLKGMVASYGEALCRFGNFTGPVVAVPNSSFAWCRKPAFPDALRDATGPALVELSANGQCFTQSTTMTSFVLYNSQLDALKVTGVPSGTPSTLELLGEGFVVPTLAGASCRFSRLAQPGGGGGGGATTTPLTAVSSTLVTCPSPASATSGSWRVRVLQNGQEVDPALSADPILYEYSLAAVKVRGGLIRLVGCPMRGLCNLHSLSPTATRAPSPDGLGSRAKHHVRAPRVLPSARR